MTVHVNYWPQKYRNKSVCNRSSHHIDVHTPHLYCLGSCVLVHVWEYVGQCGARSDCTHSCSGTFVASNSHAQSFLHAFLFSINFYFTRLGAFFIMNVVVVDRRQDNYFSLKIPSIRM